MDEKQPGRRRVHVVASLWSSESGVTHLGCHRRCHLQYLKELVHLAHGESFSVLVAVELRALGRGSQTNFLNSEVLLADD